MTINNLKHIKEAKNKEYLGYCNIKGYIYSIQIDTNAYAIVSVVKQDVSVLITYTVK